MASLSANSRGGANVPLPSRVSIAEAAILRDFATTGRPALGAVLQAPGVPAVGVWWWCECTDADHDAFEPPGEGFDPDNPGHLRAAAWLAGVAGLPTEGLSADDLGPLPGWMDALRDAAWRAASDAVEILDDEDEMTASDAFEDDEAFERMLSGPWLRGGREG